MKMLSVGELVDVLELRSMSVIADVGFVFLLIFWLLIVVFFSDVKLDAEKVVVGYDDHGDDPNDVEIDDVVVQH